MRKVKSLVKKLLGKPVHNPFTIDMVNKTANGFCVIGWFLKDDVVNVTVESATNSIDAKCISVPRDDVEKSTGKKAEGFELHVTTDLPSSAFKFCATTKAGALLYAPLPNAQEETTLPASDTKIESAITSKNNIKAACEYIIETPSHFYVVGWVVDNQKASNFKMVDKKGNPIAEYIDGLRSNRKDVLDAFGDSHAAKNSGFNMLLKKLPGEHAKPYKLTFRVNDEDISLPIDSIYNASADPATNALRLLNNWYPHSPSHIKKADMFAEVLSAIFPANDEASVTRFNYNGTIDDPVASIIIPLYGRYDFMRYQLSNFSTGNQTENCEVIYVIDDPKIAPDVLKLAREMEIITSQSFSVLRLSKNVGFGKANNIGVKYASSDIIALLNSDILPKSPDWLDKLIETAKQPSTGIVGARLLFEDESIQHDGMAPMRLTEYPGLIFNDHPRKGWPKELSPYNESVEPCPLITAACWVMKKANFTAVGGFAPEYVLGDFEDSDLCLQMLELGLTNYIRRDVELYHLERQSQNLVKPGRWKHNITILNAIYFNKKWKATLEKMEEATA